MSFSAEVKEEIALVFEEDPSSAAGELAALGRFARVREEDGRTFFSAENPLVVKKYFTYREKAANIGASLSRTGDPGYCRAYLRGAFLAAGSVSDPASHYHLEVVCPDEAAASDVCGHLQTAGFSPRVVSRKKHRVVYLKEGDQIADFLTLIGAHRALLRLENVRVLKEVRNSVNRAVNCDAANIAKSVEAARKQREDILLIEREMGLGKLPGPLRAAALARLAEPEATLTEIGERMDPPVGKSGISHRMGKIAAIAAGIRLEQEKSARGAGQEDRK